MKTRTKWIIAGGAAAVLAVILWLVLSPSGVEVEVATVTRDTLSVAVREEGRTRAGTRYVVGAPTTGRLSRTDIEEGTVVEQGDTLATIAPPPEDPRIVAVGRADVEAAEAQRTEAEAAVAEAESAHEQALREVERRRPLLEMGSLSEETFERFEEAATAAAARVERAGATLQSATASLAAARSRLLGLDGDTSSIQEPILAPVAGTVLRVMEESERVVQAGTPLFALSATETGMEVVIDVLTEEAVTIEPDDPIRITGWGGEGTLNARVRYVEPEAFTEVSTLGVEEQRVNVVGGLLRPPPGLGSGFRVDAAIVTWTGDDILTVPTSSIFQRSGGWRTFVVDDGRARLRAIEVGRRGVERVQVLDGLSEGQRVILFPSDLVGDGVEVQVTDRDGSPEA